MHFGHTNNITHNTKPGLTSTSSGGKSLQGQAAGMAAALSSAVCMATRGPRSKLQRAGTAYMSSHGSNAGLVCSRKRTSYEQVKRELRTCPLMDQAMARATKTQSYSCGSREAMTRTPEPTP